MIVVVVEMNLTVPFEVALQMKVNLASSIEIMTDGNRPSRSRNQTPTDMVSDPNPNGERTSKNLNKTVGVTPGSSRGYRNDP